MFAFEIAFYPTPEALVLERREGFYAGCEGFHEQLEQLERCFRQNGNSLLQWQVIEFENQFQARLMTPEKESLESRYFDEYTLTSIQLLNSMSTQPMQIRFVGKIGNFGDCCQCEEPSSYALQTSYIDIGLPVVCNDCGLPLPFYKLPVLEPEKSYWQLYDWQKSYAHLDSIYMDSFVGERMAYHQLSNPRSQFMRHTRELAKTLETASGKPVYVYLLHVYKKWGDNCPLCKRVWRVENPEDDDYEFECEHCRLLSPEATANATPLSELHP